MQSEEHIVAALKALAEQDRQREAPAQVENRLLQAFRRKQTLRKWRNGVGWSLAAAAAITAVFLAGIQYAGPQAPPAQRVTARPPQIAVELAPQTALPDAERAAPAAARRPVKRPAPPKEIVTEFFPLLDVSMPFERGELLRVTVPASTMRKVGLPVNQDRLEDRIYADVLVGQEGLARAIRFVSYQ